MSYKGSCHCGSVTYEAEGELGKVMECNCSHCARKGFLLWFVPRNQLRLSRPDAKLTTYTFNKHVIKHQFCPTCGTQPFAYGVDPQSGAEMAAINVRCLEGVEISTLERMPFDGASM